MSPKTTPLEIADNVTSSLPPTLATGAQPFPLSNADPAIRPPAFLAQANALASLQPSQAAPEPPAPDRFLELKIESLQARQRADSFFNSLDSDQANKLGAWMIETDSLIEIYNRVKAPSPEGLGIDVNISTLCRLRDAWRAEDLRLATQSMYDVIIDLEQQTDLSQIPRIQGVMNHLLHETAFEQMRKHPASPLLPELLANIQKLTDLDLRRQKLQLEREKLLLKSSASAPQPKHHRIDLNIVPPARNPITTATP